LHAEDAVPVDQGGPVSPAAPGLSGQADQLANEGLVDAPLAGLREEE